MPWVSGGSHRLDPGAARKVRVDNVKELEIGLIA
jgi:hypothetical protein